MDRLRRLARLPAPERGALLSAVAWCCAASLVLKLLPFRRVADRLGRHMAESAAEPDPARRTEVRRIGWAVATAARHLPWKPVCLPQAVAAQWMLRRIGIPSTLYLGIDPNGNYDAHAWVRAGAEIVTGGPSIQRYAVVSTFA
ncbi:MAG: lasso peptide biosynthesis B2 protein [Gemmatimonadetes bacterium]|nr:lasso peptide biosynthesis B2 protein [Gemmatimonadota bacterium]